MKHICQQFKWNSLKMKLYVPLQLLKLLQLVRFSRLNQNFTSLSTETAKASGLLMVFYTLVLKLLRTYAAGI